MSFSSDEICVTVSDYVSNYSHNALFMVEGCIKRATTAGNWDDLEKWHRVRIRINRLHLSNEAIQHVATRKRRAANGFAL